MQKSVEYNFSSSSLPSSVQTFRYLQHSWLIDVEGKFSLKRFSFNLNITCLIFTSFIHCARTADWKRCFIAQLSIPMIDISKSPTCLIFSFSVRCRALDNFSLLSLVLYANLSLFGMTNDTLNTSILQDGLRMILL